MSQVPDEWTVLSMLEWATEYFKKQQVPEPRLSIEWLLAYTLDVQRLDLYLQYDRPLSKEERNALRPLVKRRANHEPLQYITGSTDFMRAEIEVDSSVLIPRIETEQLIEIILDRHSEETLHILDIGTGSGCIPIALKMERPDWQLTAVDISESALDKARRNAERNEVEIKFMRRDLYEWRKWNMEDSFDLIISNPPYVQPAEKKRLESQVRDYEPEQALFVYDIHYLYRELIDLAGHYLTKEGTLYLETHEHHTEDLLGLFEGNWQARMKKDYSKKPRFLIATRST